MIRFQVDSNKQKTGQIRVSVRRGMLICQTFRPPAAHPGLPGQQVRGV